MAASTSSVITCYVLNLLICLGCFLAFSVLRLTNQFKRFFAPRRYARDIRLKPRRLPTRGVFTWVWPIFTYTEGEIIDEVGLDAAMYLRIFTFGLQLFAGLSVWCLIAVLPVNLTGGEIEILKATNNPDDVTYISFDKCSLTNVSGGSSRMWMHMLSVYVITLYTLWLLWRFNQDSVKLRVMFLARSRPGGPTHTILVTDIPGIAKMAPSALDSVVTKMKSIATPKDKTPKGGATSGSPADGGGESGDDGAGPSEGPVRAAASPPPPPPPSAGAALPSSYDDDPRTVTLTDTDGGGGGSHDAGASTYDRPAGEQPAYTPPSPHVEAEMAAPWAPAPPPPPQPPQVEAATTSAPWTPAPPLPSYPTDEDGNGVYDGPSDGEVHRQPAGPVAEGQEPLPSPLSSPAGATSPAGGNHKILSVASVSGEGLRRRRTYNVKEPWLDAEVNAVTMLTSGMSAKEMVEAEFRDVYPANAVVAVNMVNDQASLEPLVEEFDQIKQALDDYLDECNFRMSKGQYVERMKVLVLGSKGEWGKARGMGFWNKVDAIDYWTARLTELSRLINLKQDKSRARYTPSAFVTFSSRVCQSTAASSLHYHDETCWRTQNAPEPFELVWHNLAMKLPVRTSREIAMWVIYVLMTLFFMIPIAALQAIINLDNLSKNETLAKIVNTPPLKQLLQGLMLATETVLFFFALVPNHEAIIPGLVLVIFLALVPTILAIFMNVAGAISQSEIDFGVVVRFYAFQVVVVFFYNVIGGSLVASLQQWLNDPSGAITILGTSIPVVSTFFITYILVKGVGGGGIGMLRVVPLVLNWLSIKLAKSPKAQYRIWSEQYTKYGDLVAPHTIVMLLGIVYSLINPIITPTVLLYFIINAIIQRYETIYVYRKKYESGGRMWRLVFHQVMFAMYLFQVCMLGLLGIKKFKYTPIIIPVIIITAFYHAASGFLFSRPWTLGAQHDAADLDRREAALALQPGMRSDAPTPSAAPGGKRPVVEERPVSEWVERYDMVDSTDPDIADGPPEEPEPVEIAYLSRVFKIRVPTEAEGLLRDADTTVLRIEAQGPKPTKKELKDQAKAAKEEKKRQRAALKSGNAPSSELMPTPSQQQRFSEAAAV